MEGEINVDVNHSIVSLRKGDWLLIKSGVKHGMHNSADQDFAFFNVHFDIDDQEARKRLGSSPCKHISGSSAPPGKLTVYVRQMEQLMGRGMLLGEQIIVGEERYFDISFEDKLWIQANILLIIHEILNILRDPKKEQDAKPAFPASRVSAFTLDLAHQIEEQLNKQQYSDASIANVAQSLNLSLSQCSKIFQQVYGISPRKYVSRVKLAKAKELLTTTNMSVGDIADTLGFHSASHFSRQFRRWTRQSPNQYRDMEAIPPITK